MSAIKFSNITRPICTKAFLRISLSVISDQITTSATISQFCTALNNQKGINGIAINQISPNKWITNNELQYSYGWLGIKCQSINQHQVL